MPAANRCWGRIFNKLVEKRSSRLGGAGSDMQVFRRIFERLQSTDFKNEYQYGALSPSPNSRYKAGISVRATEEYAMISATVYDESTTEKKSVALLRCLSHDMFIGHFVYNIKWLNDFSFEISDRSEQFFFVVELPVLEASLQVRTAKRGLSLPDMLSELACSQPSYLVV